MKARARARARVLIFTGEGKGKTTAALGMVLRAAGHGMSAAVIQFIKGAGRTGELSACRTLPGVSIEQVGLGFVPRPTDSGYAAHREAAQAGLVRAAAAIAAGTQLVVMDELCSAVAKELVEETQVLSLLEQAKEAQVLVLTGRGAGAGLIERADTVSEIRSVKHGLKDGIAAQAGVEY